MTDETLNARERWNRRYAETGVRPFLDPPSQWLVDNRALLNARSTGLALDVACGGGRNSAFLAQLGFEVEALDVSDHAISEVNAAVAEHRLAVRPRRVDLENEQLPVGVYDVIVQFNYLQRDLFDSLARALTPGGLLLAETRLRAEPLAGEEPFNPRFALETGELRAAFGQLEIVRYWEGPVPQSSRPRSVARLAARRPVTDG
jgi:SAM-dependent methyltransferase